MSDQQQQQQHVVATADNMPRSASDPVVRKNKKKRAGRGRMMMVKIFYSLTKPGSTHASGSSVSQQQQQQQQQQPSQAAPSPAFLSVLDPALAPSPAPSADSDRGQQHHQDQSKCPSQYKFIARLSTPVWVQLVGSTSPSSSDESVEFGKLTLKTCLGALCISRQVQHEAFAVKALTYEFCHVCRPELVADPLRDYAVSALDPYESSLQSSFADEGLIEGKGMLSWNLAEKREGTTFVNGRVSISEQEKRRRSRKRRRLDGQTFRGQDQLDDDDDTDDETPKETLEVWLQLVERPAFSQTQFMTSLKSFANPQPAQPVHPRVVDPIPVQNRSGDPVKRKRTRDLGRPPSLVLGSAPTPMSAVSTPPLNGAFSASDSAPLDASVLTQLQDPRIRGLLAEVIPSLAASGAATSAMSLDSEQRRQLLPAIRTLAQYFQVALPQLSSTERANIQVPSSSAPAQLEQPQSGRRDAPAPPSKSAMDEYTALDLTEAQANEKTNPQNPKGGCSNCKRKKSTMWWQKGQDESAGVVCNACGVFYNRRGFHRRLVERNTSPVRPQAVAAGSSKQKTGRALQSRLTATCEADLKKLKSTKQAGSSGHKPGMVPPSSPSKTIGPQRSPGSSLPWVHRAAGLHMATSPGRSPGRRRPTHLFGMAATSPVRAGKAGGMFGGLRSGYESDGEGRGNHISLGASIFGGNRSPSPQKSRHVPSFLLTESPGTALNRLLTDTNVAMDGLDDHATAAAESRQSGSKDDIDFLIDPALKENNPLVTDDFFDRLIDPHLMPHAHSDANEQTTDGLLSFDPLSSLRRSFDAHMSSNQLTAPSSPLASSPCVLPRTSSATPGQKGKAPESSGRPAPSILDSFIDGLVPAVMQHGTASLDSETPVSDSDAYTPASVAADDDRTLTFGHFGGSVTTGANFFALDGAMMSGLSNHNVFNHQSNDDSRSTTRQDVFLPAHLMATSDAPTDFDLGSLPPSSPPQLPSEAFPTPSDLDSGLTPENESDNKQLQSTKPNLMAFPSQERVHAFMHTLNSNNNNNNNNKYNNNNNNNNNNKNSNHSNA
ncbi:hypothetical protein OIV83_000724 [Microbotryomycetes sp. JL201]|nr:hypothetical protein OIV83_000724 [Microbotryomycetes sp. JL201]